MAQFTARGAERRVLMFPGYIFFKVQRDWGRVCGTKGVASVVMCEDSPVRIPDCEIDYLRDLEDSRGLVVFPPRFYDGDEVRIVRGPFSGISGVVRGALERGHLRVLWSMLGKDVSFTVSEGSLESA
jgi:transcription antitermination factor NusG